MVITVKDENYIVIQGWMRNKLNLSGNELLVYATIYGFSQEENNCYSGGRQYLADWIGASVKTVQCALDRLIEKGLIDKRKKVSNNITFCEYRVLGHGREEITLPGKIFPLGREETSLGVGKNLPSGREDFTHNNNNIYNYDNNNKNIVEKKTLDRINDIEKIINYLNEKCNTNYRPKTKSTIRHINARFEEGYTVEDFFKVIDNKVSDWSGTSYQKYLRPDTLFATKFESYVNEKSSSGKSNKKYCENKNEDDLSDLWS